MTSLINETKQLLVIDSQIENWQNLIANIAPDTSVLVLDAGYDGLTQLANAISIYSNLSSIQIISHGSAGNLQLGSVTLNSGNLSDYTQQLTIIGNALSANGDLLLYGCNVAQGDIGQHFIEQLSRLMGADVAASTDLTGAANQGGNWVLESQTGAIEATSAISDAAQAAYQGVLTAVYPATYLFSGAIVATGASNYELWVTDGTERGAHLLKDINIGLAASHPDYFTSLGNGKTLFQADDGVHGFELWVTDGTAVGTSLVKDINTGSAGNVFDIGISLGNGRLLFAADDGVNGRELWITDGTTAGTSLVKDVYTGSSSSSLDSFIALGNGKVLFTATDNTHGNEMWITDGTTAGTSLVQDIYTGVWDSSVSFLTAFGNGKMLFTADNGVNGSELWITDGTTAGTNLLKNISPYSSYNSNPSNFIALGNGKMLFTADDYDHDTELWITDGTTAGTFMLKDINVGFDGSFPLQFTDLGNGKVMFAANDGVSGREMWVTDGTAAGTVLVKDIYAGVSSSYPGFFTVLGNGKMLFNASNGIANGDELWITDGTAAGTNLVKDIWSGLSSSNSTHFNTLGNGKVIFTANDGVHGDELWVTDGTTAGTSLVKDIYAGSLSSSCSFFISLGNGKMLFNANDGVHGNELWVTDGTTAGTMLLKDMNDSFAGSDPGYASTLSSGKMVFVTNSTVNGNLWVTDGTISGTVSLIAVNRVPTDIQISTNNVNENVAAGTVIGTLTSTDPDAGDAFTYSLVTGGVDNSAFSIVGNQLKINNSPDFEAKSSYSIKVRTTDQGGLFFDKVLTIVINNVFEAPVLVTPVTIDYTDTAFVDNFAVKTGTLTAASEAGTTKTYGITGGTDNGNGTVSKSNAYGTLTVNKVSGAYTFTPLSTAIEALNTTISDTSLSVTVSDSLQVVSKSFTVNIIQSGVTESLGNDTLIGTAGNDVINGLAGDDSINGSTGADIMAGGLGNDSFTVDNPNDIVIEAVGAGLDTVYSSISYALAANIENLVLTGAAIAGYGNDLNNQITGNSSDNIFAGGLGIDTVIGGAGNDVYYVDNTGDVIIELVNEGSDIVYSMAASYTLSDNIENLVVWGAGISGTGNALSNYIFGSNGNNTLDGGAGADILYGGLGNDTYVFDNAGDVVIESLDSGFDTINTSVSYTIATNVEVMNLTGLLGTEALNGTGNDAVNYLFGNAGNNIIDGKAGADMMVGKAGDDTYYVDNVGDVILENANEGIDTVISSVSYNLSASDRANAALVTGANADNLIITGAAINAFGNGLNNNLTGNSNNNVMSGGAGIDTMTGGAGNDVYYVDVAGDTVIEQAGEGSDIVYSSASDYTLSDNIETIVVWGSGLNGTGNAQDNYIFGNTYGGSPVNNILSGGAGNDILMGFDGADTYIGGTGQDSYNLTEQIAATDTIQIAAGDSVATVGLMDKATGFTLGANAVSSAGVDKLDLVSSNIAANAVSQNGTDAGAIQTNSITNGIISFKGVGGATIAANALNLSDALTYLQTNINDGSSVAFVAGNDTYVFQDGGVTDTVVDLVGVIATSMNNTGLAAGAVWLV